LAFCPAFAFISLALRDFGRISAQSGLKITSSFSEENQPQNKKNILNPKHRYPTIFSKIFF
jgi:hypothetical protein